MNEQGILHSTFCVFTEILLTQVRKFTQSITPKTSNSQPMTTANVQHEAKKAQHDQPEQADVDRNHLLGHLKAGSIEIEA